jgi:hypothetical protein
MGLDLASHDLQDLREGSYYTFQIAERVVDSWIHDNELIVK